VRNMLCKAPLANLWLGLLLATLGFFVDSARGAGEPMPVDRAGTLVRELASGEFAVREEASRQLIELGIAAHPALEAALSSPDAEVRIRARSILNTIVEADFQNRLEAFAADSDGTHAQSLPAWDDFSSHFGASRMSRQLFVEMQRTESEMLRALAKSPEAASEVINRRTREILDGQRESLMQIGTLAALLYVGSAPDVKVEEDSCLHIFPYVVQSTYQRNKETSLWPIMLKKLVGRWIAKDTTPAMMNQNLILAATLELKPETLAISARVLESEESPAGSRQVAMLMLSRFGDKSHVVHLEPFLTDKSVCGTVQIERPPHQVELQLRDIALAAMLYLTNQSLTDYGFESAVEYGPNVFQVGTLGFVDAATRDAALKKWGEWRAAHPDG